MNEHDRAMEYRRQQTAQVRNREARERALAGDAQARRQVEAEWEPLRRWEGWDPPLYEGGRPE